MESVSLTPDEREVILDYAAQLKKRSRPWRGLRWLGVGCFIFSLCLLLAVDHYSAEIRSRLELSSGALKVPENAGSKSITSALEMVATHGEVQVAALRTEFYLFLKALIVVCGGTGLVVHAVSNWRRDKRDLVGAKLLDSLAATESGGKVFVS
jgi:hypothetical protein